MGKNTIFTEHPVSATNRDIISIYDCTREDDGVEGGEVEDEPGVDVQPSVDGSLYVVM